MGAGVHTRQPAAAPVYSLGVHNQGATEEESRGHPQVAAAVCQCTRDPRGPQESL